MKGEKGKSNLKISDFVNRIALFMNKINVPILSMPWLILLSLVGTQVTGCELTLIRSSYYYESGDVMADFSAKKQQSDCSTTAQVMQRMKPKRKFEVVKNFENYKTITLLFTVLWIIGEN